MNKKIFIVMSFLAIFGIAGLFAQESGEVAETTQVTSQTDSIQAFKYIAAGLAVGIACIAGGSAVGKIGAAAMGAMSENAELSGKALPFVGLAEGICLWGFLVALLIIIL
nr:ATP synthase subunit C [uncultured Treponema sp.]